MLGIIQEVKEKIHILEKLLPVLSFIIPFLVLYSLYPKSFVGDPTWEGNWQGRFFYLFFLWIVSLEITLGWENLQTNKMNKLGSKRTVAFIVALLLPTIYVIVANYCGLNSIIVDLAEQNSIPQQYALLMPLSTEYFVFATLFALMILLAYGIDGLKDFSISTPFLGIIGVLYTIDLLYPVGRFTPFQILVPATATLAANVLNLMGYQTEWRGEYLGTPVLKAWNSQGKPSCSFSIAWPCAGVESLLIYTLTILLFLKKAAIPWKQKIIYFVIGAIVTYFINILRIATIFVISIPCDSAALTRAMRFHNIYGQLFSITWIISYPLIIIGSRILWKKISVRNPSTQDDLNNVRK